MTETVESPTAPDPKPYQWNNGSGPGGGALLLIAFFLIGTITVIAGFMAGWRPPAASEEGQGIDETITYLLVSTGVIVLVGHAVLCWFLLKGGGTSEYRRPSAKTEWLFGLIPVILMLAISEAGVLIVSGPVWDSLFVEKPVNPVRVEVIGKQFEWIVRYPGKDGIFGKFALKWVHGVDNPAGLDDTDDNALDDVLNGKVLVVPVGRPVVVSLRSHDVIHSFFVPDFRVKQDLLPGYTTEIKFTPTRTGKFEIACAELCGLGHYNMRGEVHVLPQEEYDTWIRSQTGHFGG